MRFLIKDTHFFSSSSSARANSGQVERFACSGFRWRRNVRARPSDDDDDDDDDDDEQDQDRDNDHAAGCQIFTQSLLSRQLRLEEAAVRMSDFCRLPRRGRCESRLALGTRLSSGVRIADSIIGGIFCARDATTMLLPPPPSSTSAGRELSRVRGSK